MADTFDAMSYYQRMTNDNILMSYNGPISQSILIDLGMSLKNKSYEVSDLLNRRMFAIFIEMAQNILLHSEDRLYSTSENKEIGQGLVLVRKMGASYSVISGNLALSEKAKKIQEKCLFINSLDKENLKQFFKEQRKKPHEEGKAGGNIGFLEIARKSGNPIDVNIQRISDKHSFMVVQVKISIESIMDL